MKIESENKAVKNHIVFILWEAKMRNQKKLQLSTHGVESNQTSHGLTNFQ